jgi:AAA+ superfamily predicted ATPase
MSHNRNNNRNKKNNKPIKFTFDTSNNNVFVINNEKNNFFDNKNDLHNSNNQLIKINSNTHYYNNSEKNNIKPFSNCNTMITTNKLITSLDNSNINSNINSNKINKEKTNCLLKLILNQTEKEFNQNYNSPYFSGIPIIPNMPTIKDISVFIDEDIKKIIKEKVLIDASVDNLIDLINLCDKYPLADNIEYNINMKSLHNIKPSLVELQNMIGMNSIKENIVDQIIYFIQDLHNISPNNSDYLHAVIYGPPGTGKTEVAKIMGKIFSNLGILKKNVFKKVTRDDLVAGYLGQTAMKTKDVIKECIGGVLFIDEAYALGNKEKRDSFSKESIDTICEALSDHKKDLMCIIAGYEQEIKDCFFSYNPGLESRFTWKFTIDDYDHTELKLIFEKKIKDCGWNLKEPLNDEWFEKNKDYFKYFGRDMETLFSKVKIAHSRRVFCLPKEEKTKISMKDLDKGFAIYKKMGESENRKDEADRLKQLHHSIYC